ncbi:MAG: HD domain-containing protein [Candidatus Woesebacteria bacterium]|jgi:hypothetical protein
MNSIGLEGVRLSWRASREIALLEQGTIRYVDHRYGSGYPHFRKGVEKIAYYHNGFHTRLVGDTSTKLAKVLGLNRAEVRASRLAGLAHDVCQSFPANRGHDEQTSAEWLKNRIDTAKSIPSVFGEVCAHAIVCTEPLFDKNGNLIGQRVNYIDHPSESAKKVAECVACGDFSDLFMPTSPLSSHMLCREQNSGKAPSIDKVLKFQQAQVALVYNFEFALPEANALVATHRPQVTRYTEDTLREIENGNITSWEQLIERDLAFAKTCA